jgi:hypothetical protein
MGNLGVGIMNSMAFSLPANINSKVDGNQISFGTVDYQPHPPTLTPVVASLDQGMDLTIGSLSFHVGSLGSIPLSDQTKSDPSAGKTVTMAILESSIGSSSEVNDAGRITTQLGTPRGRYDEYSSKFSLSKKPRFVSPGKIQTLEGDAC